MLDNSKFFHVGIRVTDLEAAMSDVGKNVGAIWASPQDRPMSVWTPSTGPIVWQLAVTYSIEGPVHLELMQGERGSIWDGSDVPGAHHFGYWSDDVNADTEALISEGYTLEMAAAAPEDGYGRFTYLRSPSGVLVEPVSIRDVKPRFERWWAGGSLSDPIAPQSPPAQS